jgi:ElaB/YqjD/DUF883 family membrane-anchored ribosome-binding protein
MRATNNMNKEMQAISNEVGTLAEDARALMAATADVAGEKVAEARKRLGAALESGKALYGRVARDGAVYAASPPIRACHRETLMGRCHPERRAPGRLHRAGVPRKWRQGRNQVATFAR